MNLKPRLIARRTLLRTSALAGMRLAAAPPVGKTLETVVWKAGEDGYHTYRIPSLLRTKSGALLAFCEGRRDSAGDHGDIDLLLKRSTDGGKSWSTQQLVYEEGGQAKVTIGNPCPVVERRSGTIFLPFCRDNNDVLLTSSRDDGKTWTTPAALTSSVKGANFSWYATGPGVGIQIERGKYRGRLVIPCDHRKPLDGKDAKFSHVFSSDDFGQTWTLTGTVGPFLDECQVAEISGGRLLMNMRNYWEREGGRPDKGSMRAQSVSEDGGATWGPLQFAATLVEPVCQGSLLAVGKRQANGKSELLFSNPADRQKRIRMTVRRSMDEGTSWSQGLLLHEGPSAYSCLTDLGRGEAGILYERGSERPYEQLVFSRFAIRDV